MVQGISSVRLGSHISIYVPIEGTNYFLFDGYVEEIERQPHNYGRVTLSDELGTYRDDETITASVIYFEPKMDGNCISAILKRNPSPINELGFSRYLLQKCEREINFANASKLQIIRQYCDEFGEVFGSGGYSGTFTFSKVEDYKITLKRKINHEDLAVRVNYIRQYPEIRKTWETEHRVETLTNWVGDSYEANINTVIRKINEVEVYSRSDYSPTTGGIIYEEMNKTVTKDGDGYIVTTKQVTKYNQLTDGVLNGVIYLGQLYDFDVQCHYDTTAGRWLDYITITGGTFFYEGKKGTFSGGDFTFDQYDKNGRLLQQGESYYARIYLNYLSGQVFPAKGEKATFPRNPTIDNYMQCWPLVTLKIRYSPYGSEINTGDIINILNIYGNGGHNEAHYKYFDTIEKCDEALRIYERTYTAKEDDKIVSYKHETWGEEIYKVLEKQENKNGYLVVVNNSSRTYSSKPTASAPKAEIITEEGFVQYGNGNKVIDISTSFLSDADSARDYAERKYKEEIGGEDANEVWIQFTNLLPSAKPGQKYRNSNIFSGDMLIEQVVHTIDFDEATAITEITGKL